MKKTIPLLFAALLMAQFIPNPSNAAPEKSFKVRQAFQFWNIYLEMPPAAKDGFKLLYKLSSNQSNLPEIFFVHNNRRTRVNTNSHGFVTNPPDLETWRNGTLEIPGTRPEGSRISLTLDAVPQIPLGQNIQVSTVNNAIADLKSAMNRAGPVALVIPKQESIVFKGVQTGFAIFADGRRIALERQDGGLIFSPQKREMRGATSLNFPIAPSSAEFAR
jgi:hypothetical protein